MIANSFFVRAGRSFAPGTCLGRRALQLPLLVSLALPAAYAQGRGVVEGRLVNGTDPAIVGAGVELDVVGLGGGMSILKSSTSDAKGRFKIDGLSTDSPLMIRANYKSVHYHSRVQFDASGKANVDIQIFEPTTSMNGIQAEGVRMAFQLRAGRLHALELFSFNNQTQPPRSYMRMEGSFRFSKPDGILEPPRILVTGPGSAMPLAQSALESADGRSYYSLYPLRPGTTAFEVEQEFPYKDRKYTYRTKFYFDVGSYEIGVIPQDMTISGEGLVKQQTNAQRNFSIYSGGPVKAGTEVIWTISGGTPIAEPPAQVPQGEARIRPMPTMVSRNALIIGPMLLIGFTVVLWYVVSHVPEKSGQDTRVKDLKMRREQLLDYVANLDNLNENLAINRREYVRQREQCKRQLRRIAMLLKQ